jgi:hypothetical protein
MTTITFIYESEVIKYLYDLGMITNHQKKSLLGMELHEGVGKFIENTKMFSAFLGDFGCGVDCCGYKVNYRLR